MSEERKNSHAELIRANKELALRIAEKEKWADEISVTLKELAYQNREKEKHAAQLLVANKELALQNFENENLATELAKANKELKLQNNEKEKLAKELVLANKALMLQNKEKEKRAAELVIAYKELAFQNNEKEKRAAELDIANKELAFQNAEKEKRAAELLIANKELESFTFISSHDLQEPLRKIQSFADRILTEEYANLSEKGKYYFNRTQLSALRMQTLINDLLAYSRTTATERKFEKSNLNKIIKEAMGALREEMQAKNASVEMGKLCEAYIIPFQFRQLIQNLIANSLKFSHHGIPPHIKITSDLILYDESHPTRFPKKIDYCHISIADNGIGFKPEYKDRIFEIFQRLHVQDNYEGTGIGLTIVKKIVDNHNGMITAFGEPGKGCTFDIYIPEQSSN